MKIKKELTVKVIKDNDFNRFAEEHYGHDPEIVAAEEWSNDSEHLYENITKEDRSKWSDYDRREFEEYTRDGDIKFGLTHQILEDLVADGVLPEGSYLITVSW